MYTFTQLQELKARVVSQLASEQTKLTSATGQFTAIRNTLTGMQATYSQWATEVDTMAAANPADAAITALKAERDLLVAEFQSTKTLSTAYETAVNAV